VLAPLSMIHTKISAGSRRHRLILCTKPKIINRRPIRAGTLCGQLASSAHARAKFFAENGQFLPRWQLVPFERN
jgi:hypothetical protein